MNKEKTSFQNKIICSTYEIFRFILFPLVLFGVFYVSKLSNILNYTNKSENNYRIILISLIITNVIFNVIETFLFENHKTNGFEYLIITLATLILSVMFFMKAECPFLDILLIDLKKPLKCCFSRGYLRYHIDYIFL